MRKFLEGTYAARVRFHDTAADGNDGDAVISTFFTINDTLAYTEAGYSECDFEYLPNGGWDAGSASALYFTSWGAQSEPGKTNIEQHVVSGSFAGWHTLVLVVLNGTVSYYVDGELKASHSGERCPSTLMSINFNLWFSRGEGELLTSDTSRRSYIQDIDWVFHVKGTELSPSDVEAKVATLRAALVERIDEIE